MKNTIAMILSATTAVASGYSQVVGETAYLKTRVSQVTDTSVKAFPIGTQVTVTEVNAGLVRLKTADGQTFNAAATDLSPVPVEAPQAPKPVAVQTPVALVAAPASVPPEAQTQKNHATADPKVQAQKEARAKRIAELEALIPQKESEARQFRSTLEMKKNNARSPEGRARMEQYDAMRQQIQTMRTELNALRNQEMQANSTNH